MILAPPKLSDLRTGTKLKAGLGVSTILPDIDFETYSPAGFVWDNQTQKFKPPHGANVKGLFAVNAAAYSEHPDAEVLSLAYDLKDGQGRFLWTPNSDYTPCRLFQHVVDGGILEAWNSAFEYWIWNNICVPKYGFPLLHVEQLRCAASKSRAHCLPGSLADCGKVLNTNVQKDKDGKRLLEKFSIPRNATKNDPRTRILPSEDVEDAKRLYAYNLRDIEAEAELSSLIPDLSPSELQFWLCDQKINRRGVQVDAPMISACMTVVEQAHAKYNRELQTITGDEVQAASEIAKMVRWMHSQGVHTDSLTASTVTFLLNDNLPQSVRRVLEIRELIFYV
jgi:DNA polymerase